MATHPGGSTAPKGVASGGEAVGYSVSADDRDGRAVVWPPGLNVPVALSSERSFAFAVSDDGLSVGGAINTPQRNHAALFVGGATLLLPDPFPPPGENPSTYVSAVIDGTTAAHVALEARIAAFVGRPAARIFNSAYTSTLGLAITDGQPVSSSA